MEKGKLYALSVVSTLLEQNKTEATEGTKKAIEMVKELQIAVNWIKSK